MHREAALRDEVARLRARLAELDGAGGRGRDSDPELLARSDALAERVKELKCIYSISSLLRGHHELGSILQQVVDVLPSALQHSELVCATIVLKSRRYQTRNYRATRWNQQTPIMVEGEPVGTLDVGYVETLADGTEPAFLPEEHSLLTTVAERIAEIIALKETQNQLSTYQEHLRSLASELTLAEERERRNLAISLHDRIGQGLAVTKLKLESLSQVVPAEHRSRLEAISDLLRCIMHDTRTLTFEISPPILYELGLRQAIAWLGDHFARQFGLKVEVDGDDGSLSLSEGVAVMLFRSTQELLTNVVKHACAEHVVLRLRSDATTFSVSVEDDGVGFDPAAQRQYPSAAGGFGIFSIRERIRHLGGQVEVESSPGHGTRIRVSAPGASVNEKP